MLSRYDLQNKNALETSQQGAMLIAMMTVLVILFTTISMQFFNRSNLSSLKNQKTQQALALAKQALLAYASEEMTGKPNGALLSCDLNCPRPGDLPCPDQNNDGNAEVNCSASQVVRLGRLPWKTLGIDDIRDGAGERLWYAVSNNFKNNTRILPLNSETLGTISLRGVDGNLLNDAANTTGLVAVIIAPNEVLTRADNLQQNRTPQNINDAKHYLDSAFGEDNASFTESTANGFIFGPVRLNTNILVNDVIMPITKKEMNAMMVPRVLAEVMQAVLYNFCPNQVNIKNRTCTGATTNAFFPDPALVNDISCLSNILINNSFCTSNETATLGRIPVSGNANWEIKDVNSILRGQAQHNWFQQNGWRESIFYARAPACKETTQNCTGAGYLTLNNAITPTSAPSANNKQVILISAGNALTTQIRADNTNKTTLTNYLEDENISPMDNTFARYRLDENKNDETLSIP